MNNSNILPLISIIVPVFKVEKYLNECVESVLKQEFKNFELILVDDGSPDNCPQMCDQHALKDNRIKVIHKKNGGLGDARNEGIKKATGDYLMFLDSDDYIHHEALNEISQIISNSRVDVIIGAFETFTEPGTTLDIKDKILDAQKINDKPTADVFKYLTHNGLITIACRYIIKREIIINNSLFFRVGILHEDVDWLPGLMCTVNTFWYMEKPFYYYRLRAQSISTTKGVKNIVDSLGIIERMYTYLNQITIHEKREYLHMLVYWQLYPLIKTKNKFTTEGRNIINSWLRKNVKVKDYILGYNPKLSVLNRLFGPTLAVYIFGIIVRISFKQKRN